MCVDTWCSKGLNKDGYQTLNLHWELPGNNNNAVVMLGEMVIQFGAYEGTVSDCYDISEQKTSRILCPQAYGINRLSGRIEVTNDSEKPMAN